MIRNELVSLVLLLSLVPSVLGAADCQEEVEDFDGRLDTVMITVEHSDREEPDQGTGVLLCTDTTARKAWVLTAYHVIAGHAPPNDKVPTRPEGTELKFYGDRPAMIDDRDTRKIRYVRIPGEDLLLLEFDPGVDRSSDTVLATPLALPEATDGEPVRGEDVVAVGYPQKPAKQWSVVRGNVVEQDGNVLYHTAPIGKGFSGGPLFTPEGALLAVNVEDKAGELLEKAESRESREGGSVHLQGMRYTRYLPHYHLGLVHYHQDRCEDAIREWNTSENQGTIRDDRRYRSLKRLRDKCRGTLRERQREKTGS